MSVTLTVDACAHASKRKAVTLATLRNPIGVRAPIRLYLDPANTLSLEIPDYVGLPYSHSVFIQRSYSDVIIAIGCQRHSRYHWLSRGFITRKVNEHYSRDTRRTPRGRFICRRNLVLRSVIRDLIERCVLVGYMLREPALGSLTTLAFDDYSTLTHAILFAPVLR